MTDRVLVDSSAWVEAMRQEGDEAIRGQVQALLRSGRAVLCDFVRLELWNGARGEAEKRWLRGIEQSLETVATSAQVWTRATELARRCRRRGATVPAADLLIAACARHHGIGLLHIDDHFDEIDRVTGD